MINPEDFDPTNRSEMADVLKFVGKRFYDQCDYFFNILQVRSLIAQDSDELIRQRQNQHIIDFQNSPGSTAEYRNTKNEYIAITKREGKGGLIEFEISYDSADDDPEADEASIADWMDTYLLQSDGTIVAAEHCVLVQEYPSDYKITPIEINAEELMAKINNDFQPRPEA